jgi:hypothetical protein
MTSTDKCPKNASTKHAAVLGAGIEHRASHIPGIQGLYATKAFKKGEIVTEYNGTLKDKPPEEEKQRTKYESWYEISVPGHKDIYLDGATAPIKDGYPAAQLANDPRNTDLVNGKWCYTDDVRAGVKRKSELKSTAPVYTRIWLRARKNIAKGDEIFVAYGSTYWKEWAYHHQQMPIKLVKSGGKIKVATEAKEIPSKRKEPRERGKEEKETEIEVEDKPVEVLSEEEEEPLPEYEQPMEYLPEEEQVEEEVQEQKAKKPVKSLVAMFGPAPPITSPTTIDTYTRLISSYWERYLDRNGLPATQAVFDKMWEDDRFTWALKTSGARNGWTLLKKLPPRFAEIEVIAAMRHKRKR